MADSKDINGGVLAASKNGSFNDAKDLSSVESDTDVSSHRGDVFDTSGLEDLYRPISSYEGIHRYDPKFQWPDADEKKVVRRVC